MTQLTSLATTHHLWTSNSKKYMNGIISFFHHGLAFVRVRVSTTLPRMLPDLLKTPNSIWPTTQVLYQCKQISSPIYPCYNLHSEPMTMFCVVSMVHPCSYSSSPWWHQSSKQIFTLPYQSMKFWSLASTPVIKENRRLIGPSNSPLELTPLTMQSIMFSTTTLQSCWP